MSEQKAITRLELLAGQLDLPALTPELQAPQRTFGINLSFWKLCLEARKIRNEEKKEKEFSIGYTAKAPIPKKEIEEKPEEDFSGEAEKF